ncbi:MAG: hypothetical protein NTZ97_02550 [Candidatus Moranbacteria bacterium]|nr:hypothetical protein [Candidatus Moranbacteria bacterium]
MQSIERVVLIDHDGNENTLNPKTMTGEELLQQILANGGGFKSGCVVHCSDRKGSLKIS